MQQYSRGIWKTIGGVVGIATIIALLVAVVQLLQSKQASDAQDSAQATQIAILNEQLNVQREMATLQAGTSESGPAATAVAQRLAELETTAVALATREANVRQIPNVGLSGATLLSEDFESNATGKYFSDGGRWTVVNDGTGNHVLKADSVGQSWSYYRLGLPNFANGVIEYRVRLIDFDASADTGSGHLFVIFRESANAKYQFVIQHFSKSAAIYFQGITGPWILLTGAKADYQYNFQKEVWYFVRVEGNGDSLRAYVDGNLAVEVEDKRANKGVVSLAIGPNTIAQYDDIRVSAPSP
jgi:hypothetical protein